MIKNKLNEKELKYYLNIYDIDSIEDFEPEFYYMNLVNGYKINRKAIKELLNNYDKEILIQISNYSEIGIVEFVADNQYYIDYENNKIKIYE